MTSITFLFLSLETNTWNPYFLFELQGCPRAPISSTGSCKLACLSELFHLKIPWSQVPSIYIDLFFPLHPATYYWPSTVVSTSWSMTFPSLLAVLPGHQQQVLAVSVASSSKTFKHYSFNIWEWMFQNNFDHIAHLSALSFFFEDRIQSYEFCGG